MTWIVDVHYFKRDRKYNRILESKEDINELNERLEEIEEQMMNLIRLSVRIRLDNQIYDEEY